MKFVNYLNLFKTYKLINSRCRLLRNLSTIPQPVDLAYSSYENTNNTSHNPPPLIVLHGLFGSKSNWNSLCKTLHNKIQRKIIALDHRNHGDSPHTPEHTYEHCVDDLKLLLEHLNIEKCSLLGHSMGGRTSMLYALKYPRLVDKLIIVDISPIHNSPNLFTLPNLFATLLSLKLPTGVTMVKGRQLIDQQLSQTVNDKNLRAFLLTNLIQKDDGSFSWRINIPVLLENFQEIATFPQIVDQHFNGPTLFLGGSLSDYIHKEDHGAILEIFPKAQFRYVEGAGHWVHSEKPQEFLDHVTDFLNR